MDPKVIASILMPLGMFGIPIVAILAAHQRKMAALIHQQGGLSQQHVVELYELRREVENLKEIVHTQALALDDQATLKRFLTESPPAMPTQMRGGQ